MHWGHKTTDATNKNCCKRVVFYYMCNKLTLLDFAFVEVT